MFPVLLLQPDHQLVLHTQAVSLLLILLEKLLVAFKTLENCSSGMSYFSFIFNWSEFITFSMFLIWTEFFERCSLTSSHLLYFLNLKFSGFFPLFKQRLRTTQNTLILVSI